jgi:chemotaxis protein MotB
MSFKNRSLWKKPKEKKEDGDIWITSYGDMMTLLLVFFVLMFAISEVDPVKMQQVTQQMRAAIGGEDEEEFGPSLKELEQQITASVEKMNISKSVQVNRNKDGVELVLSGESFFSSGNAELRVATHVFLKEVAVQIAANPYLVSIEGHTDNIPIRSQRFPSNWELSGARASAVARYFEQRGIPRTKMRIIGWADAKPVNPDLGNSTASARAQNRRIVITFLNEYADLSSR